MTPNNYKDQFTPEQAIKGVIAGIYAYWPTEEVDSMVDMMERVLAELAPAPVRHNDQFTEWLEKHIAKLESDIATCPGELTERRVRACMAEAVRILEQYRQLAPTWIPVKPDTMPEEGRVLCFSPVYPEGDPMRYRVLDAQFVPTAKEVTHYQIIVPPINKEQ